MIQKFEEEAMKAEFAFVLLTPDDTVTKSKGQYLQARPNVIFELGWFYGRLGRARVCILYRKGTKIHSDLDGVSRIEFGDVINEKLEEIERELMHGGLIGPPRNRLWIISARYGAGRDFVDVTERVRARVIDDTLHVPVSNDLVDGKDPCYRVLKALEVEFELDGRRSRKTMHESFVLNIP